MRFQLSDDDFGDVISPEPSQEVIVNPVSSSKPNGSDFKEPKPRNENDLLDVAKAVKELYIAIKVRHKLFSNLSAFSLIISLV